MNKRILLFKNDIMRVVKKNKNISCVSFTPLATITFGVPSREQVFVDKDLQSKFFYSGLIVAVDLEDLVLKRDILLVKNREWVLDNETGI